MFGVLAVYQAMLPLLRKAPQARIVNVSSGVGSLTMNSDPAWPYRSIFGPVYPASKTALNAMTLAMAIELESTGIKVNAASPGFTRTNLNNYAGTETVEEGAREAVRSRCSARTARQVRTRTRSSDGSRGDGGISLMASSRPPGANLRPPAGRDIVGRSVVTWSSRHSNRGDRPVPPLAAGPPSSSIRPTSEVALMIATRAVRLGVCSMLAVAWTSTALAWGPQGHRVIARVAEGRLNPAAKAAIKELLIPPDTLPDVADWADREGHDAVPGSARWHFINVPIGSARFDPRLIRDDNNVVVKIKQYRKVLSDRSRPKKERQRALLFFVHFVSDIHQPLHVGDHDDHGGNDTQIRFFDEGTNLHRLWDSDLIHRIGGDDRAWVSRVEREITPEAIKEWSKGSVDDWADESLQVAKLAYRPLDDAPKIVPRGYKLGESYLVRAEPILKKQMARASVRLANELNAIFK